MPTRKVPKDELQLLRTIMNHVSDAVVACDKNGTLTYFNKATTRLHGIPEAALPPERWAEHYDLYKADGVTRLKKNEVPLFRALSGETVQDEEIVIAPKKANPHRLLCDGCLLYDEHGKPAGAYVIMREVPFDPSKS
ncbi:MAG TPA: PAS domain-containing protein [Terriglobales bacterium]|nr:PAS domain-containing protein [Terriglobales bacterium]